MSKKRILLFHPAAGIRYFSESVIFFANKMKRLGFEIDLLGCDKDFSDYCNFYAAKTIPQVGARDEKVKTCNECLVGRLQIEKYFGRIWTIRELLGGGSSSQYEAEICDINTFVHTSSNTPIDQIEIDGFPIGRMAAYEFILNNKIANINEITPELKEVYFHSYFKNCVKTLRAVKNLLSQQDYYGVYVYNSCYGAENVISAYFKAQGKDSFFVHGGRNLEHMYSSFYFSRLTPPRWNLETIKYFRENYDSIKLDYSKLRFPLDHFKALYASKSIHTYSVATSAEFYSSELWKKIPNYKKVVLISLSSGDEFYAADFSVDINRYVSSSRSLFKDRFEWLQELVNIFGNHPDCLFILRFHPREFPNKREKLLSKEVKKLEAILTSLPAHVHLNYPRENLSIYNILQYVDLHLCGQSSVGFESSALGVPTICYIDGIGNYPISRVASYPEDRESYFRAINSELVNESRTTYKSIKVAFEWLLFLHGSAIYNFNSRGLLNPIDRKDKAVKKILRKIFGYGYQIFSFQFERSEEAKFEKFLLEGQESFQLKNMDQALKEQDLTYQQRLFLTYLDSLRELIFGTRDKKSITSQHNRVAKNLSAASKYFEDLKNFSKR